MTRKLPESAHRTQKPATPEGLRRPAIFEPVAPMNADIPERISRRIVRLAHAFADQSASTGRPPRMGGWHRQMQVAAEGRQPRPDCSQRGSTSTRTPGVTQKTATEIKAQVRNK